jgi:hypothetical protein
MSETPSGDRGPSQAEIPEARKFAASRTGVGGAEVRAA